ncbi:MAG: GlpM family protein [Methanomicrobiales archaeon]|nr:GlpM family protein [Methanomicrobiales archaeon]
MEYLYTALRFIVGGLIVVGVPYLAEYIDPRFGGLLTVAPIATILAFIFTRLETTHEITQSLVESSLFFAIPFVLFLASLYLLLQRLSFAPALIAALLIWLGGILIVFRLL